MADAAETTLEAAIADIGLRLLELEKFAPGTREAAGGLRTEALALGGRARRLHRAGTLGDATASGLEREAQGLLERLRDALQAIRSASPFRAAVDAHRAGDHARLASVLPLVFDDLEWVPHPPALFHAITWVRRNRPRPPAEVVADIARLREHGLPAEGDVETAGVDPELPAVALATQAPADDPVFLRFATRSLPPAVFRLGATGAHLVHVPRLTTPFDVIVPATLEDPGEITFDHPHYRDLLLHELARVGLQGRTA